MVTDLKKTSQTKLLSFSAWQLWINLVSTFYSNVCCYKNAVDSLFLPRRFRPKLLFTHLSNQNDLENTKHIKNFLLIKAQGYFSEVSLVECSSSLIYPSTWRFAAINQDLKGYLFCILPGSYQSRILIDDKPVALIGWRQRIRHFRIYSFVNVNGL